LSHCSLVFLNPQPANVFFFAALYTFLWYHVSRKIVTLYQKTYFLYVFCVCHSDHCKQLCSLLKNVKSRIRAYVTDVHLERCMYVAAT
jgi:hypothetical protein